MAIIVKMRGKFKVNKVPLSKEKAHQILLEEGLEITQEEVEKVLEFLQKLAILVLQYHLKQHENSRFIRKGQHRRTGR